MRSRDASLFVMSLILAAGCARIVAPSGGPEDKSPPSVVSVSPPPSAGVPELDRITISWDERLQQSTIEAQLFPRIPARIGSSQRSITISLEEPLGARTLLVHIPSSLSDQHGNELGATLDFAYSGLDTLPSGVIRISTARQGGTVFGAEVRVEVTDESNELVRRTTPDSTGIAFAGWLPGGGYSVLCYEDLDRSMTWERDMEAGAETTLVLPAADTLTLDMVLTVVDTVGPRLVSVTSLDAFHLQVDFNEQPAIPAAPGASFSLSDPSGARIGILGCWGSGARDARSLILATGALPAGLCILRTDGTIEDLLGNASDPDSIEFTAVDSVATDSLRLQSMYPPPGATEVSASTIIAFSFSDWVDYDSLLTRFSLSRVLDGSKVEGTLTARDSRSFEFAPLHDLMGEEQYRVEILSGLESPSGDTLQTTGWAFVAAWGDEPGSIEGVVRGGGANIVIGVTAAGSSGDSFSFGIRSGPFVLEGIPAGRYTVSAWTDRNGNGVWDPGEPYGNCPGVVLVNPGIATTGVAIEILP
ncbi:MAG TPA: Ig-like domain-containing protein [Candidatus Fermentibacter daniensis]|nr:MAG: hypothetical protein AO395_06610 [Candidatus Fermentibacter daniensis]MBP7720330.1 Ig-like domain-containing protein [Candidatus Fermentibacter sp.]KZD18113.1 MAG: hypothetical protein AO396_02485 [Candidatus Fermentibacter daniensis]KZD18189.1 MAG: hypothetical protein AO394_04065 [Candidatus Fermentibacter daniensis]MCC6872235.1 Ig-like domain-containing protein [Candidatus Fermentibacter sp.]